MARNLTRRSFVQAGGVAASCFALFGLAGCAGGGKDAATGAEEDEKTQANESPEGAQQIRKDEQAQETSRIDQAKPEDSAAESSEQKEGEQTMEDAQATEEEQPAAQATAVVFFSCTGNTQAVAEKLASVTGSDLLRIEPAQPYSSEDIDYNTDCRANHEQDSVTDRPELAVAPDVSGYDTVYLGYPIWWGKVPRVILTYVEQAALTGKTVVPFCTSGSSSIDGSLSELESAAAGVTWGTGRRFSSSVSEADLQSWIEQQ